MGFVNGAETWVCQSSAWNLNLRAIDSLMPFLIWCITFKSGLHHRVYAMIQDEEQAILSFLKREALASRFESTTAEIARGVNLSYNQVARVLERLIIKAPVGYRERGTERKSVRYFYLVEIADFCRGNWQ